MLKLQEVKIAGKSRMDGSKSKYDFSSIPIEPEKALYSIIIVRSSIFQGKFSEVIVH